MLPRQGCAEGPKLWLTSQLQSGPWLGLALTSPPGPAGWGLNGLAPQADCMAHVDLTSETTFVSMLCLLSTWIYLCYM